MDPVMRRGDIIGETMNVTTLAKALISCPSVTPVTAGVFDVIENFLVPLGFVATRQIFEEAGTAPVENLYLRYGTTGKNFCFAGHTDVVPVGDVAAWKVPPFTPEVIDGELYGRGAEDMKGAVAAFMVAAREFISGQLRIGGASSSVVPLPLGERLGEGRLIQSASSSTTPHPTLSPEGRGLFYSPQHPAPSTLLPPPCPHHQRIHRPHHRWLRHRPRQSHPRPDAFERGRVGDEGRGTHQR